MHKQLQITKWIILLLYFQPIAQSFQIYQLSPNEENDLIPKLKRILGKKRNEELFKSFKNNVQRPKPLGKSIFVKRIIPHGYRGGKYEYDTKLNTVYKPLIRFHIKKPIVKHEKTILKEIQSNRAEKDDFKNALIIIVNRNRSKPKDLLQQIKKYINLNPEKQKKNLKSKLSSLLNTLQSDNQWLRSVLHRSGEEHDPLAPGKVPAHLEPEPPPPDPRPKYHYPTYPFWNYWTNQKTIINDECRGNLIKVGDVCIHPIGHRKSLNTKNLYKSLISLLPKNTKKAKRNQSPRKNKNSMKYTRKSHHKNK